MLRRDFAQAVSPAKGKGTWLPVKVSKLTSGPGVSPDANVWNALEEFAVGVGSVEQPREMFSQPR